MKILIVFIAGMIFGFGLLISGMNNPQKVINFLDVAGDWDPSLIMVMLGAILVTTIGYTLIRRSGTGFSSVLVSMSKNTKLDSRLIGGAVLFGIGWGIAGVCPGPALVNGFTLAPEILVFLVSMIGGMVSVKYLLQAK